MANPIPIHLLPLFEGMQRRIQIEMNAGDAWAISKTIKYFVQMQPSGPTEKSFAKLSVIAESLERFAKEIIDPHNEFSGDDPVL